MIAANHLDARIDALLATALRGEEAAWPSDWSDEAHQYAVVERALYHGLPGLLVERADCLVAWPDAVVAPLKEQALGRAMWELRHQRVLTSLLTELAAGSVKSVILKGTAVAYDLYENPATRARGDTDLLIHKADLPRARAILAEQGFVRDANAEGVGEDILLQEIWRLTYPDGTNHDIDLHWQTMNAPALERVLSVDECFLAPLPLPRLSLAAMTLDRVTMLTHTIIHRAGHITSPYFLGNVAYYGGDRLIWAVDIHRLAEALSDAEWRRLVEIAREKGLGEVCLNGLQFAQGKLGTELPRFAIDALGSTLRQSSAARYLLRSGQFERAWRDFQAQPSWRQKAAYLAARTLPSPAFIRAKYPGMHARPLPILYLRRAMDLLRERPGRSEH